MVDLLRRWEKGRSFIADLLEKSRAETAFSGRDRSLITATVNGVIRRKKTLDWLIDHFSSGKPPAGSSIARQILRLSIFHLIYLDALPPHAVLHQAGELSRRLLSSREGSYINGLLRNILRERDALPLPSREKRGEYLSVVHSHPRWLVDRWLELTPFDEVEELCRINNLAPPIFARCNLLRATPEGLEKEFRKEGIECSPHDTVPGVWRIKPGRDLSEIPAFRAGHFVIQDTSALRPVDLLAPRPGEKIADLCAAPGGKTSYIAQKMANSGCILAADASPERIKKLAAAIERLGIGNTVVRKLNLLEEERPGEDGGWDGILLDVPCSNTGVLRRRVDARWRIKPDDICRLAGQGGRLLRAAAGLVRPGGRIIYSTCSLEPEENGEIVAAFLRDNADFSLEKEDSACPEEYGGDGFYAALLRRKE
ncbi:MAG: 16S rRNA (cytosine(967)-C(5))-methyltransferase RsmB [PVC group bacterium]